MKHRNAASIAATTATTSQPQQQQHQLHAHLIVDLSCSGLLHCSLFGLVLMLTLLTPTIWTRRLQRCELASELYILDISKGELPLWLCIAEFESRFNTHVIGTRNEDGSKDYGIFQISDKFWCLPENETDYFNFNDCNVNCSELMTDDITPSVKCAQTILKQQGWTAWSVYEEFCNETLDDTEECFQ